jgi:hypothetical protein
MWNLASSDNIVKRTRKGFLFLTALRKPQKVFTILLYISVDMQAVRLPGVLHFPLIWLRNSAKFNLKRLLFDQSSHILTDLRYVGLWSFFLIRHLQLSGIWQGL